MEKVPGVESPSGIRDIKPHPNKPSDKISQPLDSSGKTQNRTRRNSLHYPDSLEMGLHQLYIMSLIQLLKPGFFCSLTWAVSNLKRTRVLLQRVAKLYSSVHFAGKENNLKHLWAC